MAPSVFLSFAMEDKPLVELFRGQARRSVQLGKRVLAVNLWPGPLRIPAALVEVGRTPLPSNFTAIAEALNAQGDH